MVYIIRILIYTTLSPTPPVSPPTPSAWHGRLELIFNCQSEKTILSHSHAQAPLKIQRPFYPEGNAVCHSVLLHTAGGMVGGDRLSLRADLMPQAQALVTTAAAAKIYRSNGQAAFQDTQLTLAAGTCLEWLPQDTILFDGAVYQQSLRVDLAPGAIWLGWDITRLGRSARGEKFMSGRWRSHIEVWQGDRLLWLDPQQIEAGSEQLDSLHGLAGCPVIGSFACIGHPVSKELVEQARGLWAEGRLQRETFGQHSVKARSVEREQEAGDREPIDASSFTLHPSSFDQVGVTRLISGLLCRYRGHSSTEARRWFIQVWHLVRRSWLQRSECLPRVWQL